MARFEMKVHEPLKVQVEFSAVFTMKEWQEIRVALGPASRDQWGPVESLKDAIDDMLSQVNKEFRAWPQEKSE